MKRIRVTHNGKLVAEIDVDREIFIGRSSSADVRVKDTEVSGKHLRVRPLEGGVGITDLRTTNGTFLDDTTRLPPDEEVELLRGRKATIGAAVIEVVAPAADSAPSSDFFGVEATVAADGTKMKSALIDVAKFKHAAPRMVIAAQHDRRTVPLREMKTVIGRDADAVQVEIRHGSISAEHAVLTYEGGVYSLRDLGSSNGTFVDGNRIEGAVTIRPETAVTFGTVDCLFTCNPPESDDASELSEVLARHAVAMSKATSSQAKSVLDEHRRSGRLLGELFVEKGVLLPHDWAEIWRQRDVIRTLATSSARSGGARSWLVYALIAFAVAAAAFLMAQ